MSPESVPRNFAGSERKIFDAKKASKTQVNVVPAMMHAGMKIFSESVPVEFAHAIPAPTASASRLVATPTAKTLFQVSIAQFLHEPQHAFSVGSKGFHAFLMNKIPSKTKTQNEIQCAHGSINLKMLSAQKKPIVGITP